MCLERPATAERRLGPSIGSPFGATTPAVQHSRLCASSKISTEIETLFCPPPTPRSFAAFQNQRNMIEPAVPKTHVDLGLRSCRNQRATERHDDPFGWHANMPRVARL